MSEVEVQSLPCTACGHVISNALQNCPHCGFANSNARAHLGDTSHLHPKRDEVQEEMDLELAAENEARKAASGETP